MNPEFKKHVWMECSLHRLVVTPILLGIVILTVCMSDMVQDGLHLVLDKIALTGLFLFSCVGGSHAVASAMGNEYSNKSWDWVRLGARSSWEVTWGKILGASSYMLYGASWFAVLYLVSPAFLSANTPYMLRLKVLAMIVITALLALAMSLALSSTNNSQTKTGNQFGKSMAALALLLAFPLLNIVEASGSVTWYLISVSTLDFMLLWGSIFAIWAWVGSYRQMRTQLQFQNGSLIWALFNITIIILLCGFINTGEEKYFSFLSLTAFASTLVLTYFSLLAFPPTIKSINTLLTHTKHRAWQDVDYCIPPWLTSTGMALVSLLFVASSTIETSVKLQASSLLLFVLRDTGLFIFFCFGKHTRRAPITLLVYQVVLYIVLPALLIALLEQQKPLMKALLQPFWPSDLPTAIAAQLCEVVLVYLIVWRRIKRHRITGAP